MNDVVSFDALKCQSRLKGSGCSELGARARIRPPRVISVLLPRTLTVGVRLEQQSSNTSAVVPDSTAPALLGVSAFNGLGCV